VAALLLVRITDADLDAADVVEPPPGASGGAEPDPTAARG
jgi:hypothetical protein